jgi:hypothetical protein
VWPKVRDGEVPTFHCSKAKRRVTAGGATEAIFVRHSRHGGICWEQCESPEPEPEKRPGRYKTGRKSDFDSARPKAFLSEIGDEVPPPMSAPLLTN